MIIGDRIRALREVKNLSQGEIESRTGLLRCYISRVENGHTVPAFERLDREICARPRSSSLSALLRRRSTSIAAQHHKAQDRGRHRLGQQGQGGAIA